MKVGKFILQDRGDYVRVGVEDKNVSMGLETDMGVEWCSTMLAVLSHSGAVTLWTVPVWG